MDSRSYLLEIRNKDCAIKDKIHKLSELKYRYFISSNGNDERVQTSLTADKMSDLINDVIILENEIDMMIDDLDSYKKEAKRYISMIGNGMYSDILYSRYFLYESVSQVAADKHKKPQTIKNYTRDALKKLQKILDVVM